MAFSIDGVRHLDGGRLPACARTRRKLGVSGGDEGGTSKSATCIGHAIDVLEKGNGFGLKVLLDLGLWNDIDKCKTDNIQGSGLA